MTFRRGGGLLLCVTASTGRQSSRIGTSEKLLLLERSSVWSYAHCTLCGFAVVKELHSVQCAVVPLTTTNARAARRECYGGFLAEQNRGRAVA